MPTQHLTSEKKWEIFLKAIGAEIGVTKVTDNKVIFKTTPNDLEHFRTLLASPDELKKNVIHALFNDNKDNIVESELYNADTSDVEIGELFYKLVDGDLITEYGLSKILETIRLEAEFNKELLTAEIQLSCGNPIKHKMDESKLETLQAVISDENKLSKILTGEATPATDYTYPPTEFSKLISQIISHKENNSLTFTLNNGAAMQAVQAYKVDGKPPIIANPIELFV